ncbi:alpha/beta hydrolase [Pseudomonas sp. PNP]|uniref:alpha/beta hydrolase n=1 Tax=Pseudomonas sp. PNP TaxID=361819 RepID=UPI001AEC7586|nr:alpha/beta hydrolase [Pseudomonas sp. PNP]MBP2839271.1 alpha/beta hydrolase [Pseudomonas sp. PNP]
MRDVQFKNRNIVMAGHLYLPAAFAENQKYPSIIVVHPGGGVKEQTAGTYARLLAEQGFVTLAFDASYQGASGGEPHFLDEPMNRVADIYAAVDYLTTLGYVDAQRIGVLGICAGGGFAAKAASVDRRIKALATASAVNVGTATRKGWEGKGSINDLLPVLDALAGQRTAEAGGAEPVYAPYVPQLGDTSAPRDLQEAADYYLTPRAQHPNAQNKMLMNGLGAWVAFDAFDLIDQLLTQPALIIAGSEAGSLWHSQELHAKALGKKELVVLEGLAHMDLYDGPGVGTAIDHLVPFFQSSL